MYVCVCLFVLVLSREGKISSVRVGISSAMLGISSAVQGPSSAALGIKFAVKSFTSLTLVEQKRLE